MDAKVSTSHDRKAYGWKDLAILATSFVPAAIVSWGVHEYGHFAAGQILGYDMWMSFNRAGPTQGHYDTEFHEFVVAMAGPVVTWIQAFIALAVIRWSRELWTYSFLFLTSWSRSLAMLISFISNPNDEARASLLMGMPMWVLPTVSVGLTFLLTLWGSRILGAGWKGNVTAYVAASLVTAAVVLSDQLLF